MGNATGQQAGSQAGQQYSGSQAGQGASGTDGQQQQQQNGSGSQAGQNQQGQQQQQEALELPGMLAGESVKDYAERIHGALQTARKQAATYRNRLSQSGQSTDDDDDAGTGTGSGSQAGQGQQRNQQGSDDTRLARLEKALADERAARRTDRMTSQLTSALAKEGALNPDRALRLIDFDELNVSDDGTIDDPLGAVRALKASDPYLFGDKRGSADGGAGMGSEPSNDINAMIRAKARK